MNLLLLGERLEQRDFLLFGFDDLTIDEFNILDELVGNIFDGLLRGASEGDGVGVVQNHRTEI